MQPVVQVCRLKEIQLSIKPEHDPDIPGHVVIPELNSIDYAKGKSKYRRTLLALALIASDPANILIEPQRDRID